MTLLEYVQSLQEQGAIDIPAKVQEWKKKNQPKVEEEVVEEVKIDPVVETETDAPAPGTTDGVSENLDSGDSELNTKLKEDPFNLKTDFQKAYNSKKGVSLGQLQVMLNKNKKELYGDVPFAPEEILKANNYEYKYKIVEKDDKQFREFYYKAPGSNKFINVSEKAKNNPKNVEIVNQEAAIASEMGFLPKEVKQQAYKQLTGNRKIRKENKLIEESNAKILKDLQSQNTSSYYNDQDLINFNDRQSGKTAPNFYKLKENELAIPNFFGNGLMNSDDYEYAKATSESAGFIYGGNKTAKEKALAKIRYQDLDLENPYLYFNKNNNTDFIEKNYGGVEAMQAVNINPLNFEGFLIENGYNKDYNEDVAAGKFKVNFTPAKNQSIPESVVKQQKKLNLLQQRQLQGYLSLYMRDMDYRYNEKQSLLKIIQNPKDYQKYDATSSSARGSFLELPAYNEDEAKTIFNYDNYFAVSNVLFPEAVEADKQILNEKIKFNAELKNRSDAYSKIAATLEGIKQIPAGFIEETIGLKNWGLDALGFDRLADMSRGAQKERELEASAYQSYTTFRGKTLTVENVKYAVDENGTLWDVDKGFSVAGDPEGDKELKELVLKDGVDEKHSSYRGYSFTGGRVGGGLILQVIGTKGTTKLRLLAKTRVGAAINGFGLNTTKYKNYIALAEAIGGKAPPRFKVPVKMTTVDNMIFQGGYGAIGAYENILSQAKAAGLNDEEAQELASSGSIATGVWYAATGPMNDKGAWFDDIFNTATAKNVINKAIAAYRKNGYSGFIENMKGGLLSLGKGTATAFEQGFGEAAQENTQQAGETLINKYLNNTYNVDFLDDFYSNEEIQTTTTLSFLTAGILSRLKMPNFKSQSASNLVDLAYIGNNASQAETLLQSYVENGKATQQEMDDLMEAARAVHNQTPLIPKWLNQAYTLDVAKLMQKKQDLLNDKKNTPFKLQQQKIDEEIENIDLEIDAYTRQSADEARAKLQKGVGAFVEAVSKASDKDVDIENFGTTAEANAYRQELQDKGNTIYQSENYGDFVIDKKGNITVIVDDQVNTEDNVVTTEVHEGGHLLVSATVKKDPKAAAKLGNSLLEELASNSNIEIKNDRVAQKIAQYVADGVSTADVMEEVLMFTSQALIDGDIVFNETAKTKIGDVIRRTLQNVFGIKVKFKNGESVVNFLRDYNKTIESGKASKGLVRTAIEGAKVTIKDSDIDAAKKLGRTEVVVNEETGIAEDIEVKPVVEKESSKASQRNEDLINKAEEAVQDAINADPGNPDYFNNIEKAENALDAVTAESETAENIRPIAKKKAKSNKTTKAPELGPKDPVSKKIMDTYNEGMEGVDRPESTSAKPLPASLERKLIPMFDGYINTIVQQKFKQLEPEALQYQDAVSILRAEVVNAIRTFDPKVNKNLAGYVKKYGVQTRQSLMFKDANTEFTVGLENAASTISTKTETDDSGSFQAPNTVDVTKFGPAKNKKSDLENIIQVEDADRPNFKTLNNKYFNEVSESLFGIEGKKVRGNVSLKYGKVDGKPISSEANILQNLFKSDESVRDFIRTMPPYNVATKEAIIDKQGKSIDVSRDTYGRSLGINPKVLKTFYQKVNRAIPGISNAKGRSLGKTTQTDVFELKREFTPKKGVIGAKPIAKLQSLIGINKGELSIPIKAEARTEFGSALTGLSKMYVDNVINTIGRSKLDSSQAKADLAAGKNRAMASKRITTEAAIPPALMDTFKEISILKNKKQLANKLGFSSPPINESNRKAQQDKVLEAVKIYGLDTATIEAGMMGSGGRQSFYGNIVKGKFVKKAEKDGGKKYVKTTDGEYILEKSKRGKLKGGEVTNWVAKPGRLYYGNEDPAFQALIAETKKYKGKKAKRIGVKGAFTEKSAEQSKINMDVLDHVVNQLADAVAKGMSLDIAGAIVIQSYQATSGLIKIAAPFKYKSKLMEYAGFGSKQNQREGAKFREEHNPPASVIGAEIMFAIKHNAAAPIMKAIKENYYQTQLSKRDDNKLDMAKLDATLVEGQTIFNNPISRLAAAGIDLQTLINPLTGKTIAEESGFGIDSKVYSKYNANEKLQASSIQNEAILEGLKNPDYNVAKVIKASLPLVQGKTMASKRNSDLIPGAIAYNQPITVQKGINALEKTDKALANARKLDQPVKKIRVFDFDDTLARSKSMVIVNMPDGSSKKINATQFAQQAASLESEGAEFDFAEFSEVVEGKKGPLFEVAQKIASARGTEDVFILTARPQNADGPIKAFMKANGIDIPLKNITGLGDGTAEAKAGWMMGKAAEGYNDFYFADDAIKNVQAVKDVLSQIDVKSEVQLAKASKRITFDTIVNDMIEDSSGIETYKQYSAARAQTVGANKGRFNFFIPASAEDFTGLLYKMLGKGKKGDAQMAFLKTNLLDTYDRAESAVTQAKIAAANDFKALKQNLKTLPKSLSKPTGIGGFTFSHAVRVAVWSKQGMDIPGLSKRDIEELNNFVDNNAELSVFTDELMKIQKGKLYPKPGKSWLGGNITGDIINDINKVNRAEYQQEWRENVDIIFSEDNMNKMEAAYGTRWRKAIEDSLRRMKAGSNRPPGGNSVTDGLLDWLNNSVGAVMFLNTRSALLQTISAVNFINWGDNNIVKAGVAFANQKQFWGDFMTLMNSDYLVERRNGLKINVSESEIADAVRDSKNKVKSAIAFLLSKGFVMTRFADSFAIATGGSTFYRNRVKALVGKGMEQGAAEAQAFEDFRQIAEESQQSSNPNRISQQQASGAGRVILAWANTPMQYARIQKRASQDLINGRGDWKTNVSKIVYYGAVQNLIFNALQQAVFALGFGEDEDEEAQNAKKSEKISRVANGMIDSQLKGLGIGGAAVVALKSTLMELGKQYSKDRPKYEEAVFDLLGFSPPLGSKVQKINGGLRSFSWNMKDIKDKGLSLDNPAYLAGAQITTGLTNIPLDRVIKKINSMRGIVNEQSALWQKVALGLGWSTWDVGLGYYGGFDAAKVLTPEEEKVKEIDDMKKLTKTQEQIDMLLDLGLTKKEIKALGKEQSRVEKIIELQNAEAEPKKEAKVKEEIKEETKPKPEVKAKPEVKVKTKTESVEKRLRRQFDSIKDENKPDQVKTLLKFGLTKKEIRTLQYEKNRVNKILELMEKNK